MTGKRPVTEWKEVENGKDPKTLKIEYGVQCSFKETYPLAAMRQSCGWLRVYVV